MYTKFIDDLEDICKYSSVEREWTVDNKGNKVSRNIVLTVELSNWNVVKSITKLTNILNGDREVGLDFRITRYEEDKNKSETIILKDMITIPVLSREGLFIGSQRMVMTNILEAGKGWQLDRNTGRRKEGTENKEPKMMFRPERGSSLDIITHDVGFTQYVFRNSRTKIKTNLGIVLRALTGLEWDVVRDLIGVEGIGLETVMPSSETYRLKGTVMGEMSLNECKQKLVKVLLPYKLTNKEDDIEDIDNQLELRLLSNSFYMLSDVNLKRVKRIMSFSSRCRGLILAEDIFVEDVEMKKGTTLTTDKLKQIDESSLQEIYVQYNNRIHKVVSRKIGGQLDVNHLINAANILVCDLDGLNTVGDLDSIDNKISNNAYTFFKDYVERSVDEAIELIRVSKGLAFSNQYNKNSKVLKRIKFDFKEYCKVNKIPNLLPAMYRNSMSASAQHYKITNNVKQPTTSQRELRNTSMGFICSQGSPESEKVGITQNMTAMSYSNKSGELCNHYEKLDGGRRTGEVIPLTSYEAQDSIIITHMPDEGTSKNDIIEAWRYGEMITVDYGSVDYVLFSPESVSSRWATIGPFMGSNTARRVQMSGNHADQYLPILGGSRHVVTSGISSTFDEFCIRCNEIVENICLANKRQVTEKYLNAGISLVVITPGHEKLSVEFKSNHPDLSLSYVKCVDYLTTINQLIWSYEVNTELREELKWYNNEIVLKPKDLDTRPAKINSKSSLDFGGVSGEDMKRAIEEKDLAMGKPIYVGIMSHKGIAYEDGVGVRKGFVESGDFSNVFTRKEELKLEKSRDRETLLIKHSNNDKITMKGLPMVNKYYGDNETLVEYIIKKEVTDAELRSSEEIVMKKTLKVKKGYGGYVQSVDIVPKGKTQVVVVTIGGIKILDVGDKFTGHHGNKGTVCRIIPDENMPCNEEGRPLDMFINPLGVPSRMNIGQLKEIRASKYLTFGDGVIVVPPFASKENNKLIDDLVTKENIEGVNTIGNIDLYDPENLRKYPNKVEVGLMYYMKLDHSVSNTITAIAEAGARSSKTGQPSKSANSDGGQSISELITNGIIANKSYLLLDVLYGASSDDLSVESKIHEDLMNEGKTSIVGKNDTYKIQHAYFKALGFDIAGTTKSGIEFNLLTDERINEISHRVPIDLNENSILYQLSEYKIKDKSNNYRANKEGYVHVYAGKMAWVNPAILNSHMCSIIPYVNGDQGISFMSSNTVEGILNRNIYLEMEQHESGMVAVLYTRNEIKETLKFSRSRFLTGGAAILKMFSELTKSGINTMLEELIAGIDSKERVSKDLEKLRKAALASTESLKGIPELKDLITNKLLLIPLAFRPENVNIGVTDSLNILYKKLIRDLKRISVEVDLYENGSRIDECSQGTINRYNSWYQFLHQIHTKDKIDKYEKDPKIKSPLHMIKDKDTGITRSAMLSKKVKYSSRSVIVGSPDVPLDCANIPRKIIYTVYKYHMVYWLKNSNRLKDTFGKLSNNSILNLIDNLKYRRLGKIAEESQVTWNEAEKIYDTVYEVVNEHLLDELILLIREPGLQRQNIEAFIPRLTEDKAIGINILICNAYNADFDGDQMAGIVAINEQSKEELRKYMTPDRMLIDDQTGKNIYPLKQDLVLGYYSATMGDIAKRAKKIYTSVDDLEDDLKYSNLNAKETVRLRGVVTYLNEDMEVESVNVNILNTAGRIYTNLKLPYGKGLIQDSEGKHVLYKEDVWAGSAIEDAYKMYDDMDNKIRIQVLDELKILGFNLLELENTSVSWDDFKEVMDKKSYKEAKAKELDLSLYNFLRGIDALTDPITSFKSYRDSNTKDILEVIKEEINNEENNLAKIFDSGARGSYSNLVSCLVEGGYVKTLKEEFVTAPINSSLMEGLKPDEIFRSGYTVRNTQLSTTSKTREGGEISRLMSLSMSGLEISSSNCGVKPTEHKLHYKVTKDSMAELNRLALGKSLGMNSPGFNLIGEKKLLPSVLEYLTEELVEYLILQDSTLIHIDYLPDKLNHEQYVDRYGYRIVKGEIIEKEVLLTKEDIDEYTKSRKEKIPVRLTWDCLEEKGMCSKCYGHAKDMELNLNYGTRSAQSMAKTIVQLALDKKNAITDSTDTSSVSRRINSNIRLSKTHTIGVNSVYTEYRQSIMVRDLSNGKSIVFANMKKDGYMVSTERVLVSNNTELEKGIKFIQGIDLYGYLNEIKSVEEIRDLMMKDYWEMYTSNGVPMKPIHIELLIKAQSSGARITASKVDGLRVGRYINTNRLLRIKDSLDESKRETIKYKRMFGGFEEVCLQDGVMKAVCSRDPLKMVSLGVLHGYNDTGEDVYSKLAGGISIINPQVKDMKIVIPEEERNVSIKEEAIGETKLKELIGKTKKVPRKTEGLDIFNHLVGIKELEETDIIEENETKGSEKTSLFTS